MPLNKETKPNHLKLIFTFFVLFVRGFFFVIEYE